MGEGVLPDDRLVPLDVQAGHLRDEPARGVEPLGLDPGRDVQDVLARLARHHDLFERGVPGPLADPVDGALHLAGARHHAGQRVGDGQPEVVVAVDRQHGLLDAADVRPEVGDDLAVGGRERVADRVGDVDGRRPGVEAGLHHLGQERQLGPGRVLGRELDVLEELTRVLHALDGALDDLVLRHLQLEVAVDRRRGEEDVAASAGRVLERLPGGVDVTLVTAGEAADDGTGDLPRDLADRLEVAGAGGREAGLDDVDPEIGQRVRDLDLLRDGHRRAGRLLAVTEGRIEDDDAGGGSVAHGALPFRANCSCCWGGDRFGSRHDDRLHDEGGRGVVSVWRAHLFGRGRRKRSRRQLTRPGYLSRQAKKSYYLAARKRHGGAKLAGCGPWVKRRPLMSSAQASFVHTPRTDLPSRNPVRTSRAVEIGTSTRIPEQHLPATG